jgi:hypothetical protein
MEPGTIGERFLVFTSQGYYVFGWSDLSGNFKIARYISGSTTTSWIIDNIPGYPTCLTLYEPLLYLYVGGYDSTGMLFLMFDVVGGRADSTIHYDHYPWTTQ